MKTKPKPFASIASNRAWQTTIAEALAYIAELRKTGTAEDGSVLKPVVSGSVYVVFIRTKRDNKYFKGYSINPDTSKYRERTAGIPTIAAQQGVKLETLVIAEETELAEWAKANLSERIEEA